jgi:hypothetical protein
MQDTLPSPPQVHPTRALVRFLWRSGARVALRANGIVGASVVFVLALDIDAVAHLRITILQLVGRGHGLDARSELAGISLALAALAMPRVTVGATGWMRSLPVSAGTGRRAAVTVLAGVQVFTIAFAVIATMATVLVYRVPLDLAKIVSLPLIYLAAAMLVLPVERRRARAVAGVAMGLAIPGRWAYTAASLAALVLADRMSGAIVRVPHTRARTRWGKSRSSARTPAELWVRFTLRTLPLATISSCFIMPAVFTAFTALIVLHNPDIGISTARLTIRIGGMLALIALAAGLASSITVARPAWPWARSLPWSANQRVAGDAALHALAMLPVPICLALLDWRAALTLAMVVLPLAATAAAAVRSGVRRQTSAAGEISAVGVVFCAAIALWPWTAALALVTTPIVFASAVHRERSMITSRFEELHHDAAGDPAWTSAS